MASEVIEVRLPLSQEYLTVLRGIMGVMAGAAALDYERVMQLRVAVAEVLSMAIRHVAQQGSASATGQLTLRFAGRPDGVHIRASYPADFAGYPRSREDTESQALLRSLVDEVEFTALAPGETLVGMTKYRSAQAG